MIGTCDRGDRFPRFTSQTEPLAKTCISKDTKADLRPTVFGMTITGIVIGPAIADTITALDNSRNEFDLRRCVNEQHWRNICGWRTFDVRQSSHDSFLM